MDMKGKATKEGSPKRHPKKKGVSNYLKYGEFSFGKYRQKVV